MPKNFRKILFIFALGFIIFLPLAAAQADVAPALNPICWKKAECDKARAQFLVGLSDAEKKNISDGFVKGDLPCTGGDGDDAWGKCLPAGITATQISIGGQGKYANLGVYLQTVYNYALGIASILAVVMIIVAGVQWTTSGGNTELITSSKKRIIGAVTGLFIAYMSFFILNTINPALTALRLPQVFLIKSQVLGSDFCKDMSSSTQFAFAANIGATVDKTAYAKATPWGTLSQLSSGNNGQQNSQCGNQWFIQNGNGLTCVTSNCPTSGDFTQICAKDPQNAKAYKCQVGNIIGTLYSSIQLGQPGCLNPFTSFKYPWLGGIADENASAVPGYGNNGVAPLQVMCDKYDPGFEITPIPSTVGNLDLTLNKTAQKTSFILKVNNSTGSWANDLCNNRSQASALKGFVLVIYLKTDCSVSFDKFIYIGKNGRVLSVGKKPDPSKFTSNDLISWDDLISGINLSIDLSSVGS